MILWGLMDSPFTRRVAVALNHYGLVYDRRPMPAGDAAAAMAAANPLHRTPAISLPDGAVLTDARTILDWLDPQQDEERRLTPADPAERLAVLAIEAVALGATEASVDLAGEKLRRTVPDMAQAGRLERQVAAGLDWLEAVVAGDGPVAGGRLSRADLAVACLAVHAAARHPRLWAVRRHLIAYRAWTEALPCFAAAPVSLAGGADAEEERQ